jgi:hypothetical protein
MVVGQFNIPSAHAQQNHMWRSTPLISMRSILTHVNGDCEHEATAPHRSHECHVLLVFAPFSLVCEDVDDASWPT